MMRTAAIHDRVVRAFSLFGVEDACTCLGNAGTRCVCVRVCVCVCLITNATVSVNCVTLFERAAFCVLLLVKLLCVNSLSMQVRSATRLQLAADLRLLEFQRLFCLRG
jgi:hypothetical protein